MCTRRTLLLASLALVVAMFTAVAPASTSPAGSGYVWAQPGTAPLSCPGAQLPAWLPLEAPAAMPILPGSGYVWQQPGTAPVSCPHAQPPPARAG
jgi:hypothetical protein